MKYEYEVWDEVLAEWKNTITAESVEGALRIAAYQVRCRIEAGDSLYVDSRHMATKGCLKIQVDGSDKRGNLVGVGFSVVDLWSMDDRTDKITVHLNPAQTKLDIIQQ